MPIPLPLLELGSGIAETGVNALLQGATNRQNRAFAREMYHRQRQDALSDWWRQNMYNSPGAQMRRLKAAGLNPNLVYGSGAEAMSGQQPRSSSAPSGNAQAPSLDLARPVMNYQMVMMRDAQQDLMEENKKLIQIKQITEAENAKNKLADTMKKVQDTQTGKEALAWIESQRPVMAKLADLQVSRLEADIQYTLNSDERHFVATAVEVRRLAEDILNYRMNRAKTGDERRLISQQIENLKSSKALQDLEAQWMKEGKTKGDWYFWRFLNDAIGPSPGKKLESGIRNKVLQGWGEPE